MFGIGIQEMIILILGGLCLVTVAAGVVTLVVLLSRQQNQDGISGRVTSLKEENQRLREELDRTRNDGPSSGT